MRRWRAWVVAIAVPVALRAQQPSTQADSAAQAAAAASAVAATMQQPQQIGQQAANQMGTDSVLEARTSAVAAQLRCPVCQGLSIQDSPSELSQQMRSLVRDQLAAGKTPDEVKAYFISKYGEWILLEPEAKGFNTLVYALPLLLVLGGGALIVVVVRRWTQQPAADTGATSAPDASTNPQFPD
jgi:cytochrome c-type biogenesis protein CcmH